MEGAMGGAMGAAGQAADSPWAAIASGQCVCDGGGGGFVCLFVCLCVHVYLCVLGKGGRGGPACLLVCLRVSVYVSLCVSIHVCVFICVSLSVCLSLSHLLCAVCFCCLPPTLLPLHLCGSSPFSSVLSNEKHTPTLITYHYQSCNTGEQNYQK